MPGLRDALCLVPVVPPGSRRTGADPDASRDPCVSQRPKASHHEHGAGLYPRNCGHVAPVLKEFLGAVSIRKTALFTIPNSRDLCVSKVFSPAKKST